MPLQYAVNKLVQLEQLYQGGTSFHEELVDTWRAVLVELVRQVPCLEEVAEEASGALASAEMESPTLENPAQPKSSMEQVQDGNNINQPDVELVPSLHSSDDPDSEATA